MNDYDWTQEDEQQAEARFEIWNEETQGGTVDGGAEL